MSFTCPTCGRYTAGRACDRCPPDPAAASSSSPFTFPSPTPAAPERPAWATSPASPTGAPPVRVSSSGFRLRGVVVDGSPVHTGAAFPVGVLRVTALLGVIALLVVYHDAIVVLTVDTMLAFLPIFLLGIAAFVILQPFGGGCLGYLLGGALAGGLSRRHRDEVDGWDLVVETDTGLIHARVAAAIPLSEGDEVEIAGPNLGGVKQAWLFRRVAPTGAIRLGRGLFSTALVLAFFGVPALLPLFA